MRKKNVVNAEEEKTTAGKKESIKQGSVPPGSVMSLSTFDQDTPSTLPEYGEASPRKIPSKK